MRKILTLTLIGLIAFLVSCSNATSQSTTDVVTTTESMSTQISELSNPFNIALFATTDMSTSIGINFELPEDTNGYVEYRRTGEPEFTSIKAAKKVRSFDGEDAYLFEATLVNLLPNKTYEYQVVAEGYTYTSEQHTFKTMSNDSEEYSLMFLADPQETTTSGYMAYAYSVMSVMQSTDKQIGLVMIPGDLVNNRDQRSQWNQFFRYSSIFSYDTPLAAAFGNHEMPLLDDEEVNRTQFDAYLNLPNNGPVYGNFNELTEDARYHTFDNGKTYSFDYGYAHIVVIDTEMYCDGTLSCSSFDTENVAILQEWIINDFANSDREWNIVMLHRGPYGLSYDTANVRDNLVPVLEECGVDLVLSGHEHQYSRAVYWQGELIEFSQSSAYTEGDITLTTGLPTTWHFNNYSRDLGVTYLVSNTTSTKFYGGTMNSGLSVNYGFSGEYPIIPIITVTADKIEVVSYAIIKETGLSIIPTGVFILEQFQIIK